MNVPWLTRDATTQDTGFIISTWLKGMRYGNELVKAIDKNAYFDHYHQNVERILETAQVTVCCIKDDPDVIIAYAVLGSPHTLHWVFVRPAWRRLGIAKSIIPKDTDTITHLTNIGLSIKPNHWIYNPWKTEELL